MPSKQNNVCPCEYAHETERWDLPVFVFCAGRNCRLGGLPARENAARCIKKGGWLEYTELVGNPNGNSRSGEGWVTEEARCFSGAARNQLCRAGKAQRLDTWKRNAEIGFIFMPLRRSC